MRIAGQGGKVRAGHVVAAKISTWKMAGDQRTKRYTATASVEILDPFFMERGPHAVTLEIGNRTWTWQNVQVRINERNRTTGTAVITGDLSGPPLIH